MSQGDMTKLRQMYQCDGRKLKKNERGPFVTLLLLVMQGLSVLLRIQNIHFYTKLI